MKVLIAGSSNFPGGEKIRDQFNKACQALGAELVRRKHIILVASDTDDAADRHVVLGANSVEGRHRVVVFRQSRKLTPFAADREELENIQLSYRIAQGPWAVARIHQILEAHAVIVVGGGRGTAHVAYTSPALQRPVLAVGAFGGAANDALDEYLQDDYARLGFFDERAFDANLTALGDEWGESAAGDTVGITEELVRKNPYATERLVAPAGMALLQLVLYAAWVCLFIGVLPLARPLSFFVTLAIASFLGTGLRTTLRFVTEIRPRVTLHRVFSEGVIGLLLAFGLALIYLAGGITVTGDVVPILQQDDFQRVAVSMSILGFASGFLIERATERLKQRLEGVLAPKEP